MRLALINVGPRSGNRYMARQTTSAISTDRLDRVVRNGTIRPRVAEMPRPAEMPRSEDLLGDRFFRHLVFNLRTGVLAITRDGRIAAMNDMAYRVLALPGRQDYIGRPFVEVLHDVPEVTRVLQQAFDSNDLPNRAEMRLRKT